MTLDGGGQSDEAFHMSDSRELPQFELLAQTIAVRRVAVIDGTNERTYTDGESIYLADLPEDLRRASLVAQAGLLAVGSFDPWIMARITARGALASRYFVLEVMRVVEVLGPALPIRVTALLSEICRGPLPSSARESLAWASQTRRAVPEPPEWLGIIKPITILRKNPMGVGGLPSEEDREGTGMDEDTTSELDDEDEPQHSRILDMFSAPMKNPFSQALKKFFGMGKSPGTGDGGGEELPVGGRSTGAVGANAKTARTPAGLSFDTRAVPVGLQYPEWDLWQRSYRPDWCAVGEFDPPSAEVDVTAISRTDQKLRHKLARMGLAHERYRRQPEGDVLDLTALMEMVVDRATKASGDARVYESKRRTAQDLGVFVLIDITGSTDESNEGGRVFDEQRQLAARLTGTLEELGNRVATFGFYSRGREAVRFLRVKDFDDRFDHAAERRLAALSPGGFTRLGAAIRHATHQLKTRAGTSKTLLVLVGDGHPYDQGYEKRYAEDDSRQALREAVANGIGCVCLSVDAGTDDDVLSRVWGEVPYRRLKNAAELAGHVQPLFRNALQVAAASTRSIGAETASNDSTTSVRATVRRRNRSALNN